MKSPLDHVRRLKKAVQKAIEGCVGHDQYIFFKLNKPRVGLVPLPVEPTLTIYGHGRDETVPWIFILKIIKTVHRMAGSIISRGLYQSIGELSTNFIPVVF